MHMTSRSHYSFHLNILNMVLLKTILSIQTKTVTISIDVLVSITLKCFWGKHFREHIWGLFDYSMFLRARWNILVKKFLVFSIVKPLNWASERKTNLTFQVSKMRKMRQCKGKNPKMTNVSHLKRLNLSLWQVLVVSSFKLPPLESWSVTFLKENNAFNRLNSLEYLPVLQNDGDDVMRFWTI